ncbi:hypothetical protein ACQP2E_17860 [Actinoplanes sp. CA-015351]|uniref:hypothetical protein n=1 Tax=Actinoplanes sp. CA-015351 TaxID=3239897 RepID=UPI003D992A7B
MAFAALGSDESYPQFLTRYFTAHLDVTNFGLTGGLWIVAILGLLDRSFSRSHSRSFRRVSSPPSGPRMYLGEAALPLYILHQPIVVAVAYFVVRWNWPMLASHVVIVATSFTIMFIVYELLIRRFRPGPIPPRHA